jgi:hypothetical protein
MNPPTQTSEAAAVAPVSWSVRDNYTSTFQQDQCSTSSTAESLQNVFDAINQADAARVEVQPRPHSAVQPRAHSAVQPRARPAVQPRAQLFSTTLPPFDVTSPVDVLAPLYMSSPIIKKCEALLNDRVFLPFGLATGLAPGQLRMLLANQRATYLADYSCTNFINVFIFLTHSIVMKSKLVSDLISHVRWCDVLSVMSPVAITQQLRGHDVANGEVLTSADKASYFSFKQPTNALEKRAMFMFRQGSMLLFAHPLLCVLQSLAFCGPAFLYGSNNGLWRQFMYLALQPIMHAASSCPDTEAFTTVISQDCIDIEPFATTIYRDCIDRFSRFILEKCSIRAPDGKFIAVVKRTGLAPSVNVMRLLSSNEGIVLFPLVLDQHGGACRAQPSFACEAWSVTQVLYDTFAAAQYLLTSTRPPPIIFPTTPQHVRDTLDAEDKAERRVQHFSRMNHAQQAPMSLFSDSDSPFSDSPFSDSPSSVKKKVTKKKTPIAAKKKKKPSVTTGAAKRKAACHIATYSVDDVDDDSSSSISTSIIASKTHARSLCVRKAGTAAEDEGEKNMCSPNNVNEIVFLAPGPVHDHQIDAQMLLEMI